MITRKTKAYSLPIELADKVEEMAKSNYCSSSLIVSQALSEYFTRRKESSNGEEIITL